MGKTNGTNKKPSQDGKSRDKKLNEKHKSKNNFHDKGRNKSRTDNKIHYCLNPKALQKKIIEAKENEKKKKEKFNQKKKHKRNAIFMKSNDKGQPKLNMRMKVLYDQIARSCEKT